MMTDRPRLPRGLVHAGAVVLAIAALGAAAFAMAGADWPWPLNIPAELRPQIAVACVAAAVAMAIPPRATPRLALGGTLLGIAGALLAPSLRVDGGRVAASDGDGGARFEITGVNLFAGNRDHRRMLAYLAAIDSDVIVVQELTSAWTAALETLAPRYPHRLLAGGDIGVLSKHPIARVHGRIDGVRGGHGRAVEIDAPGGRVTVLALHPPAPMFAPLDARRRREIDAAAAFARAIDGPLIVSGDFNATPWSAPFRRFLASAGLALPQGAWGGTWPWFLGPFGVSIDHILAGGGCAVVERRVGPPVGSDHRPVHATVRCRVNGSPAP